MWDRSILHYRSSIPTAFNTCTGAACLAHRPVYLLYDAGIILAPGYACRQSLLQYKVSTYVRLCMYKRQLKGVIIDVV